MNASEVSYRLLRHGLILFLLGLASGLAMLALPAAFRSFRLALSAHLVGVSCGMFLLIAGLVVARVQLPAKAWTLALVCLLFGAYGNWVGTFCGAVFGTGSMTTLASQGISAAAWQETLVGAVLVSSGTAMIVGCVLLLTGLRRSE